MQSLHARVPSGCLSLCLPRVPVYRSVRTECCSTTATVTVTAATAATSAAASVAAAAGAARGRETRYTGVACSVLRSVLEMLDAVSPEEEPHRVYRELFESACPPTHTPAPLVPLCPSREFHAGRGEECTWATAQCRGVPQCARLCSRGSHAAPRRPVCGAHTCACAWGRGPVQRTLTSSRAPTTPLRRSQRSRRSPRLRT